MQISTVDKRDGQKGTVLVYDEDGPLLDIVVKMLRRDGLQVTATPSGPEAMELARSGQFDLVIVDLGRR
jgi:CheY-like chemotaxis protein